MKEQEPVTGSCKRRSEARHVIRLDPHGFTLAELLVALTMGVIVVGSMLAFFISQAQGSRLASIRIEAVQRARFAAEMLRREISFAGAGIPAAQPMIVFGGPDDFVFSADLASSTPGDRIAVYQLPNAPLSETEGADSASMSLPNGQPYPLIWYGPEGTPGPAETVRFSFVSQSDGNHALVRSVNGLPAEVLLRGLARIDGRDFFSYEIVQSEGGLRDHTGDPIWHDAAVHESRADTAASALADSVKLLHVSFKVRVQGQQRTVERSYSMAIGLKNSGLIRNAACGAAPTLSVMPAANVTGLDPISITITWSPAYDERSGEADVRQYTLYRQELGELLPKPIASLPPDPDLSNYTYVDTSAEAGKTYTFFLGATDCTPAQSNLTQSPAVTVPNA